MKLLAHGRAFSVDKTDVRWSVLLGRSQLQNHAGIGREPDVLLVDCREHDAMRRGPVVDIHLRPVIEILAAEHFYLSRYRAVVQSIELFDSREVGRPSRRQGDIGDEPVLFTKDPRAVAGGPIDTKHL